MAHSWCYIGIKMGVLYDYTGSEPWLVYWCKGEGESYPVEHVAWKILLIFQCQLRGIPKRRWLKLTASSVSVSQMQLGTWSRQFALSGWSWLAPAMAPGCGKRTWSLKSQAFKNWHDIDGKSTDGWSACVWHGRICGNQITRGTSAIPARTCHLFPIPLLTSGSRGSHGIRWGFATTWTRTGRGYFGINSRANRNMRSIVSDLSYCSVSSFKASSGVHSCKVYTLDSVVQAEGEAGLSTCVGLNSENNFKIFWANW